ENYNNGQEFYYWAPLDYGQLTGHFMKNLELLASSQEHSNMLEQQVTYLMEENQALRWKSNNDEQAINNMSQEIQRLRKELRSQYESKKPQVSFIHKSSVETQTTTTRSICVQSQTIKTTPSINVKTQTTKNCQE
uniref:Uncharacterized protein n=1 Tax=Clytia hemisphaerica TaxID=252671 RepID=A0A7M5UNQ8_9CNID